MRRSPHCDAATTLIADSSHPRISGARPRPPADEDRTDLTQLARRRTGTGIWAPPTEITTDLIVVGLPLASSRATTPAVLKDPVDLSADCRVP
jgi:hypothetical protein